MEGGLCGNRGLSVTVTVAAEPSVGTECAIIPLGQTLEYTVQQQTDKNNPVTQVHVQSVQSCIEYPRYTSHRMSCLFTFVDGNWGAWSCWSSCDVLCGNHGARRRTRRCNNPSPARSGEGCPGDREETRPCDGMPPCPRGAYISVL